MRIRPLESKDAPLMLEWLQDPSVLTYLRLDGGDMTLSDCLAFIEDAADMEKNANFAIVDEADTYLGTVSLKHIHGQGSNGEFAIALRRSAQGKGVGTFAALSILEYAFLTRGLTRVWLEVIGAHRAGIRCYERAGFRYVSTLPAPVVIHGKAYSSLHYEITAPEFDYAWHKRFQSPDLSAVRRLNFQQRGDDRGRLVIAECGKEVPFDIKRIFYIYGSDPDVIRGKHANRNSEFVLINVAGTSKVRATDGKTEQLFSLDHPHEGLYLPRMVWKEMYDFSPEAVLLVLSNECYDAGEYIRDYQAYVEEVLRLG